MDHAARERLARELQGHGVEFGPGCHPLKVGPFVRSIRYCDAHDRDSFAREFPEVGAAAGFPDPIDYRLQFDREPFVDRIGRGSLDFVVASHLLEHLVNPIRFLQQCHEVLAPGGLLFLGLPDKRQMFDLYRRRTSLSDLVARHKAGVTEVSDEQIAEFVNQVERPQEPLRPDDDERRAEIEWHRRRSIHVNVWLLDDVLELLTYLGRHLGTPWALYDGALCEHEYLLLLRKCDRPDVVDMYPLVVGRLYAEANRTYLEQRLTGLTGEVAEVFRFVRGFKKVAGAVPGGGALRRWVKKG